MKRNLLSLLAALFLVGFFSPVFASEHGGTDILPRTVNFLIFASIIYYLVADKIKAFFTDRTAKINSALQVREDKLLQSKAEVKAAQDHFAKAKKLAEELVSTAKSDAILIKERMHNAALNEVKLLEKHFEEDTELLKKKTVMNAVEEELNQIFALKGYGVSDKEFVDIFTKKVVK